MWEMMYPSLTTIIVTSPESCSLLTIVSIGIVGIAVGILILEAIMSYERKEKDLPEKGGKPAGPLRTALANNAPGGETETEERIV